MDGGLAIGLLGLATRGEGGVEADGGEDIGISWGEGGGEAAEVVPPTPGGGGVDSMAGEGGVDMEGMGMEEEGMGGGDTAWQPGYAKVRLQPLQLAVTVVVRPQLYCSYPMALYMACSGVAGKQGCVSDVHVGLSANALCFSGDKQHSNARLTIKQ